MTTVVTPMDEWKAIPWRKLERLVFKLQTRIYQAKRRGDVRTVHKLQRLLVKSWSAKCLAVRRVTQDNRGKQTAGVDGVKALTPPQRMKLAQALTLTNRVRPLRRVWIPKPGTAERRPLGIPTIGDRAAQALLKLALEPEWEAVFEPNSYGFRPGRSAHDAIEAIYNGICLKPKYGLDADIAKCFDRINHQALLQKLNATPTVRRVIRAWLQAGVMEGEKLFPTTAGTPQGGVISLLLANIALHGLETAITAAFPRRLWHDQRRENWAPFVIRYADDFVVLHQDLGVVEQTKQLASEWLAGLGLELKPSKTRIVHTLRDHAGERPGFDFLGFAVRQYPTGKTHSARVAQGKNHPSKLLGCTTIIKPSKEAMKRHGKSLRTVVRQHRDAAQATLIRGLNLLIRGWSNYYSTVSARQAFSTMDNQTYLKLRRWALRRHPNKSYRWVARKYWHIDRGAWRFTATGGPKLHKHAGTRLHRHVKVQGARSPYDGDWSYWGTRLGRHPELPKRVAFLLRKQRGRCAWCGLSFQWEDRWEVDHRLPTSQGGTGDRDNQQLLHGHCHDQKTAWDRSRAEALLTASQPIEEPDAGKLARPVCAVRRVITSPVQPGNT